MRQSTRWSPTLRASRTRSCARKPTSFASACSRITQAAPVKADTEADEPGSSAETADAGLDRARREALEEVLPEAFAVVREAGKRVLNMRHFDVQLIGGMALHNGKIAEMRTGEGKTLVATLPAYLNALAGKGVHIVTVNDYLAQRDADWMGRIYQLPRPDRRRQSVADGRTTTKQAAYAADITYGTNNEFGFDYLRDNMVFRRVGAACSAGSHYAIVDEVDSILIDEARTPLIISGQADDNIDLYSA